MNLMKQIDHYHPLLCSERDNGKELKNGVNIGKW